MAILMEVFTKGRDGTEGPANLPISTVLTWMLTYLTVTTCSSRSSFDFST